MNDILMKVQMFLDKANRDPVEISDEVLDEFAKSCRDALKKQFSDKRNERFTIRMSNIGRPLCTLQMGAAGTPAEQQPWSHKMKMLTGDVIEAGAIAIMRAAGVNIEAVSQPVKLDIAGITIQGTYDVKIDGRIFDIKSASPYAFANKFSEGSFHALRADDSFGYVAQGFGYAEADGSRFGGWIAVDKVSGEWSVSLVPDGAEYEDAKRDALDKISQNVQALTKDKPFARCFEDVPETYYRKETGNRTLGFNCEYCSFKQACWPQLKVMPDVNSKGMMPKIKYYTHVESP